MTTYVSILRGINVSGQKLIKMEALRKTYESLGFSNVKTYIQSGNVIFKGDDFNLKELAQKISQQIEKDYRFEVPVVVLSVEKLKHIISGNPFLRDSNKDQSFMHVTFLSSKPDNYDNKTIEEKKQDREEIAYWDNVIYLYCPNGYGKTKLNNNFLEAKLKVNATTRNWKTTNELYRIAQQIT
jgi:uncharacterized protein (DUF1697 family)